jgi:hypothetical protein
MQEPPTHQQARAASLPATPDSKATGESRCNIFNAACRRAMQKKIEETELQTGKRTRQSSLPPGCQRGYCDSCGKIVAGYLGAPCKTHKNIKECVADPECKPCVFGDKLMCQSFCFGFGGCLHAQKGMCNRESRCNFCHCDAPQRRGPKPQRKSRKGQPKQADKPPVKPSRSHSAPPQRCTEEQRISDSQSTLRSLAAKTLMSQDNLSQSTGAASSSSSAISAGQSSSSWSS